MTIKEVLSSEAKLREFAEKMYDAYLEGVIPRNFYFDFLNSIDTEKVFIRFMLNNADTLTEYDIFTYDFDLCDKVAGLPRQDKMKLIEELHHDGIYEDVLYRIYEKYQSYMF